MVTTIEHLLTSEGPITFLLVAGFAATFLLFAAFPAVLFGVPAVRLLRRIGVSRWAATAVLTVGGGIVGALLMFVTFGMFETFGAFEQLGAIGGASIGFVIGILFFSGSSPAAKV